MKHARIIQGVAVDVVDGDPFDRFAPELAAEFVPVPDAVLPQWRQLPVIVNHQLSGDVGWFHPHVAVEPYEHELSAGPPPVTETRYRLVDRTPAPPAPPPPKVPAKVTARQAIEALIRSGIPEELVESRIAAIPDEAQRRIARNFWARSQDFERANPVLAQLSASLGLSAAQVDGLFILAKTL